MFAFDSHPAVEFSNISASRQICIDKDGAATLDRATASSHCRSFFLPAAHNLHVIEALGIVLDTSSDPAIKNQLVLAMLGARDGCDCLVTGSAQLLRIAAERHPASNVMTPTLALAAIGVHLRLREDFSLEHTKHGSRSTTATCFYEDVATFLIPEWWRWIERCPGSDSPFDSTPRGLAFAIRARLARMLRARDRVHGQLLRTPSAITIEEALFYFDGVLVSLAGALDCSARVASIVYKVDATNPSWRADGWRRSVAKEEHGVDSLLAAGSYLRNVLNAVYLLRNGVHKETLTIVRMELPEGRAYQAAVPAGITSELHAAIEQLGGIEHWGFTETDSGNLIVDIGRYAERLVEHGTAALNQLMSIVRVERFGIEHNRPTPPRDPHAPSPEYIAELAGCLDYRSG